MLAEVGPEQLTMDALAERSGLGKGTVFRRFGTRTGIFAALLDEAERGFQEDVLGGPPPLGPGAPPMERLAAYGEARMRFLMDNRGVARAALAGRQPQPGGSLPTSLSHTHIRMLLGLIDLGPADLGLLTLQLTAALDDPLLRYLSTTEVDHATAQITDTLAKGWRDLVRRVCRP